MAKYSIWKDPKFYKMWGQEALQEAKNLPKKIGYGVGLTQAAVREAPRVLQEGLVDPFVQARQEALGQPPPAQVAPQQPPTQVAPRQPQVMPLEQAPAAPGADILRRNEAARSPESPEVTADKLQRMGYPQPPPEVMPSQSIYIPQTGKVMDVHNADMALKEREARARILPREQAPAQGRVFNPATQQWANAQSTSVAGAAAIGGAPITSQRGGIYKATPAAQTWGEFGQGVAARRGAEKAAGFGMTHEARSKFERQQELDKTARERMQTRHTEKMAGIEATQGQFQQETQGKQLTDQINELTKSIPNLKAQGAADETIKSAQDQLDALTNQYSQLYAGKEEAPAGEAESGMTPSESAAWSELVPAYESAGYDVGRMTPNQQRAYSELKKKYPHLTLPSARSKKATA